MNTNEAYSVKPITGKPSPRNREVKGINIALKTLLSLVVLAPPVLLSLPSVQLALIDSTDATFSAVLLFATAIAGIGLFSALILEAGRGGSWRRALSALSIIAPLAVTVAAPTILLLLMPYEITWDAVLMLIVNLAMVGIAVTYLVRKLQKTHPFWCTLSLTLLPAVCQLFSAVFVIAILLLIFPPAIRFMAAIARHSI